MHESARPSIVRLRRELIDKQNRASGLELILHERLKRIDDLKAKLEQARTVNHQLEAECEHLAQLVASPSRA